MIAGLIAKFLDRKADGVIRHWRAFAESFHMAPSVFYSALEEEIKSREIPGLDLKKVEWAEGGILSFQRTYLRLTRERLVFDICAAPFGKGYFFSCRFAELPIQIHPLAVLALFAVFGVLLLLLIRALGFFWGCFFLASGSVLTILSLRNAVSLGLADLDAALMRNPLLGPIYERFLRKETYYREDTRLIYAEVIPEMVKREAERVMAIHGIKLIREYDYNPILGGRFSASVVSLEAFRT